MIQLHFPSSSALRESEDVPPRDLDLQLVPFFPPHRFRDALGDRDDQGVADPPEFHIRGERPVRKGATAPVFHRGGGGWAVARASGIPTPLPVGMDGASDTFVGEKEACRLQAEGLILK